MFGAISRDDMVSRGGCERAYRWSSGEPLVGILAPGVRVLTAPAFPGRDSEEPIESVLESWEVAAVVVGGEC